VCAVRSWTRQQRTGAWRHAVDRQDAPDRESLRWEEQIEEVERRRGRRFQCIHVCDREADIYDVLALTRRLKTRFVIRATHDRVLIRDETARVLERVERIEPIASCRIELGARHDYGRPLASCKKNPARGARKAIVSLGSCSVVVARPAKAHAAAEQVWVNVVRVWESAPPAGQPPVEWLLYTSEPVDTVEQILAVVDIYRARWVIEEFFKALKTGCAFEKRQLESFHALKNALSVFLPVAWRLLLARSLCRERPQAPARLLLTPMQIKILVHNLALASPPTTAEQATYAVAKLGGHLRRNGLPGWQTLGRGFEALLLMQAGWKAAMTSRCDR
jgi:hypothetical protein